MKFCVATIQKSGLMCLRYNLSLGRDHLLFVLGGGRWAIKKNKCLKMKFSRKNNYAKVTMRNKESDAGKYCC